MAAWMLPAWQGWRMMIANSKLPAVLLAAVFYLLFIRKYKKTAIYGAVTAGLCIIPGTAAFLMKYQTAFYDYPFIWSIVPVTVLIALGGTELWTENLRGKAGFRGIVYNAVLVGLCVLVLFMSGSTGADTDMRGRQQAEAVLEEARKQLPADRDAGKAPCLWAPKEILEYVRLEGNFGGNGEFTLLYGRNMWDQALNAYTYDVYPEELKELYVWMEEAAADAEAADIKTTDAKTVCGKVEKAFSLGADCVLLPKGPGGSVTEMGDLVRIVELEQYYLLIKV